MINLWPLLLPAAAWSGWWVANRGEKGDKFKENHFSREYVVGLNYLLNEQPDKAVDLFIKLLEVDSETVETHLALGSLFRRRGEVDRAIRIHQNLIARPELSLFQRKEALMALAQDYMSAGLFDRAERIFLESVELGGENEARSLHGLLAIYQQEKAWETALEVLKKLEKCTGQSMHIQAAHYYCEIAAQSIKQKSYEKAYLNLKLAQSIDKSSVRSSLLLAQLEVLNDKPELAIKALKKVAEQDPAFISETIDALVTCYQRINKMPECIEYFIDLIDKHPCSSLIFVVGEHIRNDAGNDSAIDFVAKELSRYPSIRGINRMIHWHLESTYGKVKEKLQMLYHITSNLIENKPFYRCSNCGFSGRHLHWLCPSCKHWGKTRPIHGLEGD